MAFVGLCLIQLGRAERGRRELRGQQLEVVDVERVVGIVGNALTEDDGCQAVDRLVVGRAETQPLIGNGYACPSLTFAG